MLSRHYRARTDFSSENPVVPKDVANEALMTLALLCPATSSALRQWAGRAYGTEPIDQNLWKYGAPTLRQRRTQNFRYFHDRLVILKQRYDEIRPNSMRQFWYDRRDGPRFWAFI